MCVQAVGLAAGGMKAFGEYQAGADAKMFAGQRADLLRFQAKDAIRRGEFGVSQLRSQGRQAIGSQRAGFASQGVDVDSGSALDIQQDTAKLTEEDVGRMRANAALEAWGYKAEAKTAKYEGKMAYQQGLFQAGSSLFGSIYDSGILKMRPKGPTTSGKIAYQGLKG